MNTTDKLAEALTLGLECAYELLAEKRQALAGHPEKVAPYQEMADYLRTFPERFTLPQPALAQHREPLTDLQTSAAIDARLSLHMQNGIEEPFSLMVARAIENAHGIGGTKGSSDGSPANVGSTDGLGLLPERNSLPGLVRLTAMLERMAPKREEVCEQ